MCFLFSVWIFQGTVYIYTFGEEPALDKVLEACDGKVLAMDFVTPGTKHFMVRNGLLGHCSIKVVIFHGLNSYPHELSIFGPTVWIAKFFKAHIQRKRYSEGPIKETGWITFQKCKFWDKMGYLVNSTKHLRRKKKTNSPQSHLKVISRANSSLILQGFPLAPKPEKTPQEE